MRAYLFVWLLTAQCAIGLSNAQPIVTDTEIALQNQFVRRILEKKDDTWRTVSFTRADGTDEMKVESEEFLIQLMDGTELTIKDYKVSGDRAMGSTDGTQLVEINCVPRAELPKDAPKAITVRYFLRNEPYLRKSITLVTNEGSAIDRLEVERFRTTIPCDRGGRGEPIFIGDSWFVGLEYPAAEATHQNGLVTLAHFPGLIKKKDYVRPSQKAEWVITSKTAVAGVGSKSDPLELAFGDYLHTIQRATRKLLHYNSWYDLRESQLSLDNFLFTFESFKKNLLEPYGLTMDGFVPDDGWQDRNSIWVPRKDLYPDGFAPLRDTLQARGTRLGIWLPLNGFNLNTQWGAERGYEKSDKGNFYCLVGRKYNAAIREAVRRVITDGNIGYIKHDFNQLLCSADGHGHLPDDRHGHEANLDAQLEIMSYERKLQPDIFLNVTSYVWLSPWWLMHADSIWMGSDDFGYEKTWPQLSPREWDMSYRDTHFYKTYKINRHLVPISAMMTCGIIQGPYCKLGGDEETLREWSDNVVMFYGRGVQLQELYITPNMLDPDRWIVLGEATRWAQENREILENVVMIGGDPRKGEVYGFVHWDGDNGITILRNPHLPMQEISVPFDKSVRYRGENGKPFCGRIIYPFVEDLPLSFVSGRPATITVPGCSVMVFELKPGEPPKATAPSSVPPLVGVTAKLTIDKTGDRVLAAHVPVPNEEMQRCDLYLILRGDEEMLGSGDRFLDIQMNGQSTKTRQAVGPGWRIESIDLRDVKGKKTEIKAALFHGKPVLDDSHVTLSSWFVADRPLSFDPPEPQEHLPFPISNKFRRQTVEILEETKL